MQLLSQVKSINRSETVLMNCANEEMKEALKEKSKSIK